MLLTVTGSLNADRSRGRGVEKEGERMIARDRAEGAGPGVLLEGIQERSRRRDFEGGRGGGV